MVKKLLWIVIWICVLSYWLALESTSSSAVVQVVSYKQIFGINVQMLGWGSASIIDSNWIIITNNHVVDNGNWWTADIFNICVSNNIWEKPDCNYTASLIARDKLMDIAMLKIDSTDLKWNQVDYSSFEKFDIDFNYKPSLQDEVITIGFPWIGSQTISQTKWIVSWTSKYNNYNYIKTDAMIAGWNSWWAMINKNGKLVWIPTFLVGWDQGSNMWYALSIAEAKSFISKNIHKEPTIIPLEIDFVAYKNKIDDINKKLLVDDLIFKIQIPKEYEVKNYYENKKIELSPKKDSSYLVSSFSAYIQQTPKLETEKDLFYLLELLGFYSKVTDNIKKEIIGWITFYTAISKQDLNYWAQENERVYVWKINNENLIVLKIVLNKTEDKEINEKIDKELKRFFQWVKFTTVNIDKIKPQFKLKSPKLEILDLTDSFVNEFDGWIVKFLGNLYESYYILLYPLTLEDWKWKSVSEIYKIKTRDVPQENKTLIKFKWYEWYMTCKDDTYPAIDENGNNIAVKECDMYIFGGLKEPNWNEYYLLISLIAKSDEIQKKFPQFLDYINSNIVLQPRWDGSTSIPNIMKDKESLNFTDLWFQTTEYKKMLQLLVKYKIIPNSSKLEPYKPLTWGDFAFMYTKNVYWFDFTKSAKFCKNVPCLFLRYDLQVNDTKTNLYDLLKKVNIPFDEYVDSDKAEDFTIVLDMLLAWVPHQNINEELIAKYYENSTDDYFSDINKKLNLLKNKYFGSKKIDLSYLLSFGADFFPTKQLYYVDGRIITTDLYNKNNYPFSSVDITLFDDECFEAKVCYPVLSKWAALELVAKNMDFAMYDKTLIDKKDTVLYEDLEFEY